MKQRRTNREKTWVVEEHLVSTARIVRCMSVDRTMKMVRIINSVSEWNNMLKSPANWLTSSLFPMLFPRQVWEIAFFTYLCLLWPKSLKETFDEMGNVYCIGYMVDGLSMDSNLWITPGVFWWKWKRHSGIYVPKNCTWFGVNILQFLDSRIPNSVAFHSRNVVCLS